MPDERQSILAPGIDLPPVETVAVPIEKLKLAPWNPKHPLAGEFKRGLKANIEEFGFDDALKIWPDPDDPGTYIVINGNQRLTLLKERGVNSVHCEVKADFDRQQAEKYTGARDRNTALFDESKLAQLAFRSLDRDFARVVLRADTALVAPPPRDELPGPASIPLPVEPTVPVMFEWSREGYDEIKAGLMRSKSRLIREKNWKEAFSDFNEREFDDTVTEIVNLTLARRRTMKHGQD